MLLKLRISFATFIITLLFHTACLGFDDMVISIPENLNIVGGGIGVTPDYEGSDDNFFGALPIINVKYGNRYVRLMGTFADWNILDNEIFAFGPTVYYRFGRDSDIEDEAVRLIHKVDGSFEVGVFGAVTIKDESDFRRQYGVRIDIQQDISDGHGGYAVQISGNSWWPVSLPLALGISGGITYASDDYMTSFFSITSEDNILSGLPVYKAGAGVKDFYLQPMMLLSFSKNWHMGAGIRFRRLLSDASESPILELRGSTTQITAGIGIGYAW